MSSVVESCAPALESERPAILWFRLNPRDCPRRDDMTSQTVKRIQVRDFATFPELDLRVAPGLNVIVGENGTGKSQLLKLIYSVLSVASGPTSLTSDLPRKGTFEGDMANKLVGVLRPESLGRLTTRRPGRSRCEVRVALGGVSDIAFSFSSNSRTEVRSESLPNTWLEARPVFIPTRELLTIYPGFVPLYESRAIEFEETWRDTAVLLGAPLTRGPKESRVTEILRPIEASLGGVIVEENGRFYLKVPGAGSFEMPLVAEGLRKLGMLARLVANGSLFADGYLFWDEPEANLNPKTIRDVARMLLILAREGIQVFTATHSLFLLREIEILLATEFTDQQGGTTFIGLHREGFGARALQGSTTDDIGDIAALDMELRQTAKYMEVIE